MIYRVYFHELRRYSGAVYVKAPDDMGLDAVRGVVDTAYASGDDIFEALDWDGSWIDDGAGFSVEEWDDASFVTHALQAGEIVGVCTHEPDWNEAIPAPNAPGVFHVYCAKCGASTSFEVKPEAVKW